MMVTELIGKTFLNLLFPAPFSWGTQKRVASASKASGCFMGGTHGVSGGTGKAEDARLPDAGISLKQSYIRPAMRDSISRSSAFFRLGGLLASPP